MKVLAGSVSLEASLLGLRMAVFLLSPHQVVPLVSKGSRPPGIEPTPTGLIFNLITSAKALSAHSSSHIPILGIGTSTYGFGGDVIQPTGPVH